MKALNCIFKAKKNNIRSGEWNLHRSWSNIHPHPKFKTGLSTQPRYIECWLFERAEKESGATESGYTKRQTAGLGKGWAGEGKGALVVGHQARCPISRGWQADGALGVELLACDMVMAVNPDLFAFSVIQVIWSSWGSWWTASLFHLRRRTHLATF